MEHHVRPRPVQAIPGHLDRGGRCEPRIARRKEARVVPGCEDTLPRIGGEIGLEPQVLCRAGTEGDEAAVRVQHDDVPGSEVEAVVAQAPRSHAVAEVVERGIGRAGVVLVIAQGGVGAGLVTAPGRIVAVLVVGRSAVRERVVPQRHHGAQDRVEDASAEVVPVGAAARDVTGGEQHEGRGLDMRGRARRRAARAAGVGHRERHAVTAVAGVEVRRGGTCICAAVPEIPAVQERQVTVGIVGQAAVEMDRILPRVVAAGDGYGGLVLGWCGGGVATSGCSDRQRRPDDHTWLQTHGGTLRVAARECLVHDACSEGMVVTTNAVDV